MFLNAALIFLVVFIVWVLYEISKAPSEEELWGTQLKQEDEE